MVFTTCVYVFALICAIQCNPFLPAGSSTTVCDTTPNVLGLGLNLGGLGALGMNLLPYANAKLGGVPSTTVCESTNVGVPAALPIGLGDWQTNMLNYFPMPTPMPIPMATPNIGMPSTTVCESTPNVYGLSNLPFYGGLPYLPRPYGPYGACGAFGPMIGGLPAIV